MKQYAITIRKAVILAAVFWIGGLILAGKPAVRVFLKDIDTPDGPYAIELLAEPFRQILKIGGEDIVNEVLLYSLYRQGPGQEDPVLMWYQLRGPAMGATQDRVLADVCLDPVTSTLYLAMSFGQDSFYLVPLALSRTEERPPEVLEGSPEPVDGDDSGDLHPGRDFILPYIRQIAVVKSEDRLLVTLNEDQEEMMMLSYDPVSGEWAFVE